MIESFKFEDNLDVINKVLNKKIRDNKKGYICAVNANVLVHCYKDSNYQNIIEKSILNVCDGINVRRINNLTNNINIELLPGPKLFDHLTKNSGYTQYFLGGDQKIISGIKNKFKKQNLHLDCRYYHSPPFADVEDFNYKLIAKSINKIKPDIIWIGLGAPKQEYFMSNLIKFINKGILIGVGAAFAFNSGLDRYTRAPNIFQKLHMEWLFRAFQEPFRIIPRQLKVIYYLPRIIFNESKNKNNVT